MNLSIDTVHTEATSLLENIDEKLRHGLKILSAANELAREAEHGTRISQEDIEKSGLLDEE